MRVETVVHSPADIKSKAILAMPCGLRKDVHAPADNVCPRLQSPGPPGNFWPRAIAEKLHVVVAIDGRCDGRIDDALKRKPVVCEISERGIGAYSRRGE